jgi:phosphoribosylglycinamide formyltransferase-1
MTHPLRIGVLLSGGGTSLQNLIDRIADGSLKVELVHVASDKPEAYGLERAARAGIASHAVVRKDCASREQFSARLLDPMREANCQLICMAGFLQLLVIPEDFKGKVMNIHPSLLPAFGGKGFHGLNVHRAVVESGVQFTGCTVHFADNTYDTGPIIVQRVVPVGEDDTAEIVQANVFAQECIAYPQAIDDFANGRLQINGRRVRRTRAS